MVAASAVAVWACKYVTEVTADDAALLALDNIEWSQSSKVYAADHTTGEYSEYERFVSADSHRIWVSLENVPQNLQFAFICTEDKEFLQGEHGVNFKRTIAAAINEYTPLKLFSSRQGASTIEQQLIKNLLEDNDQGGIEGVKRKLREIYRAYGMDNKYSKETILEAYLNTISFTGTIQGVQAAANEYFNKDVSQLTLAECATIASITKNPTQYNPYTNPEALLERRNLVLYNMYSQQQIPISEADYEAAKAEPLTLAEEDTTAQTAVAGTNNSYFTDALFEQLTADIMAKEGCDKQAAQKIIYTGGLQIYATVDPFIQNAAEGIMLNTDDQYFAAGWREEEVAQLGANDTPVLNDDGTQKTGTAADGSTVYYRKVRTQASMVCMNYNGEVLGLVGGLGEKTTDLSLNRAYDVPRQTGSTMKPIGPYCLGIQYGLFNWSSMLMDSPLYSKAEMKVRDDDYCKAHGLAGLSDVALQAYPDAWRDWPSNYENTYSNVETPLYYGLAKSMNTIAARIGDAVGFNNIYDFARNTLQLSDLVEADDNLAPMILGGQSYGVTTVQLCAAYQIFYEGKYTTPHLYTEVYDASGNLYLEADTTSYQALKPQTATIMNRLLRNVMTIGTAAGYTPSAGGMEAVGKTGTASDWKDYSFVGLTPYYVAAVWWGYDAPYNMKSTGVKALSSNKPCKEAWKALMEIIQDGVETKTFPMADGVQQATYCTSSGLLATDTCTSTAVGYYDSEDMPAVCDFGY